MSKKISFALIAALATTLALSGNAQAAPPPPSKKAVAVKKISAADASRLAEKPEENLSVIDGFVWSVEIDGSVRYVDPSKVDRSITEEVVIVVEHTTAGADGNYQLKLDRDRAMSVLPKNCAKNTQGKCRWVRVLMAANNKVGYVRYVRPQSLVSTADIVNRLNALEVDKDTDKDGLLDKVDQCPNEAGPSENKGCPDKDTDKDGFVDRLDRCPAEPGVAPDGCPVKTVAVEPAPTPTAVTVPVAAPAETPKTDNTLYGYLRIGVLADIRYVAPLGSSDYASPLHRGADVGGRLVVEYDRIAASRWGLRTNVGAGFHPYVFGQANLVSTNSATVVWDVQAMYHIARTVTVAIGPGVIATHLASDGARQIIAGVGRLSVRYAPAQKKGLYADLGLGLGGGHNTERGYPERDVFVVETGIGVGYALPVKFPF
jgi:hypothetical protein